MLWKGACHMKKKIFSLFLSLSVLISLFSCDEYGDAPITPKREIFYEYFDTVGIFYDYTGGSDADFDRAATLVREELREYHELFDIYNEYSGRVNLATLNKTAGTGAVKVDKKIIDMLTYAKEMYTLTSGEVNVAFGSVLKIWHDYRTEGKEVPPLELLEAEALHTDIDKLIIDAENLTVELADPEMSLDVGAIAKGYAVEMTAQKLFDSFGGGYVLDVGGNLRTVGTKKDGTGWSAGVKDPMGVTSTVYQTTLLNEAFVTSGSYERFYTVDGVRYHHIIDKDSLMPENYYLSVSVKSNSSALSDALTTAIFNMEYDEAESFVAKLSDVTVILVMPSGEVRTLGEA